MSQRDCSASARRKAIPVLRALGESQAELRRKEIQLFGEHNTNTALRLAQLRTELGRIAEGLPARPDSLLRAIQGLSVVVPIRKAVA